MENKFNNAQDTKTMKSSIALTLATLLALCHANAAMADAAAAPNAAVAAEKADNEASTLEGLLSQMKADKEAVSAAQAEAERLSTASREAELAYAMALGVKSRNQTRWDIAENDAKMSWKPEQREKVEAEAKAAISERQKAEAEIKRTEADADAARRLSQAANARREAALAALQKTRYEFNVASQAADRAKAAAAAWEAQDRQAAEAQADAQAQKRIWESRTEIAKRMGIDGAIGFPEAMARLKHGQEKGLEAKLIFTEALNDFSVENLVGDFVVFRSRAYGRVAVMKEAGKIYGTGNVIDGICYRFEGARIFQRTFGGESQLPIFRDATEQFNQTWKNDSTPAIEAKARAPEVIPAPDTEPKGEPEKHTSNIWAALVLVAVGYAAFRFFRRGKNKAI